MATGYDERALPRESVTRTLNAKRVIAAGERMLSEMQLSPEQQAQIEGNLVRLRAGLPDEPKAELSRRSRGPAPRADRPTT